MRWPVFAIFGFLAVVIQLSVRNVLRLDSLGGISPDIVACLIAFVAAFANRLSALWACWLLGLVIDLAPPAAGVDQPRIIGPYALGYIFGGYTILQLRTMVFRRRALTLGFLAMVCVIATSIVAVFLLTLRSWYPGEAPYAALHDLLKRFGIAVYSGLIGIPIGWALSASFPVWGFQSSQPRRTPVIR